MQESGGLFKPKAPTAEEVAAILEKLSVEANKAVQRHMDDVAAAKGYGDDGMSPSLSCRAYAGYVNEFQDEAIAYGQWISACWTACYGILGAVAAGNRAIPSIDQVISELPEIVWPA